MASTAHRPGRPPLGADARSVHRSIKLTPAEAAEIDAEIARYNAALPADEPVAPMTFADHSRSAALWFARVRIEVWEEAGDLVWSALRGTTVLGQGEVGPVRNDGAIPDRVRRAAGEAGIAGCEEVDVWIGGRLAPG